MTAAIYYTVHNLTNSVIRLPGMTEGLAPNSNKTINFINQTILNQQAAGNISVTPSAGTSSIPNSTIGNFPITDSTGGTPDLTTGVIHSTFNANDMATIVQWFLMIQSRLASLEQNSSRKQAEK
jgi:hypothetical protein